MAKEEPYDRWHKARPEPGEPNCPEHPGLVPTPMHGTEMRWQACWRDKDGRQRAKNFAKNRKQAALAYQRSQRAAVAEGRDPLPHRSSRKGAGKAEDAPPTIEEYVETFLSRHEGRETTLEIYGYRLRHYVVPALGSCLLNEVKRGDYRDFFSMLKAKGMADGTRAGVKKTLSAMLSTAVEDGYLDGNPIAGIRLPVSGRRKVRLTWRHVVALSDELHPWYELLVWYGAPQVLRAGEAVGVRRTDMESVPGKQRVEA
ncbi:hypothetical protein GCM10018785_11690 [Streptomyces longispororuber]|uniref:Core-binding (CB) domain-containing protein n=1 Tax=Streptomyces longispororuber TaxID=68230 RepID=A0A918ZAK5_9ACTN|nr:hypothetical protein [Streptomyces longispororuber]GHE43768.1 hypothetical protein GCM10018785_11690 [Streptomyces longispororuber]